MEIPSISPTSSRRGRYSSPAGTSVTKATGSVKIRVETIAHLSEEVRPGDHRQEESREPVALPVMKRPRRLSPGPGWSSAWQPAAHAGQAVTLIRLQIESRFIHSKCA
jgi:hypothetical protein